MPERDAFLRALSDLDAALDENTARAKLMKRRIGQIQRERQAGRAYREIVEGDDSALIVRLLTESGHALDDVGARVRRTEALALHHEGLTMDEIAAKFGVTRQRVSALLSHARTDPGD